MPVMAYARLHEGSMGPDASNVVMVDKILTSPLRRGDGTAAALITRVLAAAGERWPGHGVRLLAPVSLRGFYEAFGFRKDQGPFAERGVRLIGLIRKSRHNARMNQRTGEADFVDVVEEV
jgi:ElaA protein